MVRVYIEAVAAMGACASSAKRTAPKSKLDAVAQAEDRQSRGSGSADSLRKYRSGEKVYLFTERNNCVHPCTVLESNDASVRVRYHGFDELVKPGEGNPFDEDIPMPQGLHLFRSTGDRAAPAGPSIDADVSKLLGASVLYLESTFLAEVHNIFGSSEQNYYDINPKLFFGPHGKGCNRICPRDHKRHSSYVDALPAAYRGRASFLLTWFWGLTATSVVSAVVNHCQKAGTQASKTFVWQCALCNNQYRIEATKARGEYEDFGPFSQMFRERVQNIGGIVALISPWSAPWILARVWCIFEIDIASNPTNTITFTVALPQDDEKAMTSAFSSEGMQAVYKAFEAVRVQDATATAPDDVKNIMALIDPSVADRSVTPIAVSNRPCFKAGRAYQDSEACRALNGRVVRVLQAWFVDAVVQAVKQDISNKSRWALVAAGMALALLRQAEAWQVEAEIFDEACALAENIGAGDTSEFADLLMSMGCNLASRGRYQESMAQYQKAEAA